MPLRERKHKRKTKITTQLEGEDLSFGPSSLHIGFSPVMAILARDVL